jgi:threonine dehydratase
MRLVNVSKETSMPLIDDILDAHRHIRPQVLETPLERSSALSRQLGCEVLLKCDHLQPTGSFKIRGATNKIRTLDADARRAGVLTASTGNHGLGVARAGMLAGVPVKVYVSASSVRSKLDAILALGAELEIIDGPPIEAELKARADAQREGKTYVSPYNDLAVVAGQGTLGVELSQQAPDLDAVFIAVGAGGLVGGVGTALKSLNPATRIYGVWPSHSACMLGALKAGRIIHVDEQKSLSDATAGMIEEGSVTFPLCQQVIDETLTVEESEIASAMRLVAETDHWMVEGAAGVALAGLVARQVELRGKKVAVVLCGKNIPLRMFSQALAMAA